MHMLRIEPSHLFLLVLLATGFGCADVSAPADEPGRGKSDSVYDQGSTPGLCYPVNRGWCSDGLSGAYQVQTCSPTMAVDEDPFGPLCPGARMTTASTVDSGNVTFDSDGGYTAAFEYSVEGRAEFPTACLEALSGSPDTICQDMTDFFGASFDEEGNLIPDANAWCGVFAGVCNCFFAVGTTEIVEVATYAVTDDGGDGADAIEITSDDGSVYAGSYCADGTGSVWLEREVDSGHSTDLACETDDDCGPDMRCDATPDGSFCYTQSLVIEEYALTRAPDATAL